MKNATGLQRTSYRARHARCVSAWTATFAWPRIVDVLPASFTASGIPHRCACHCQRKIQRKMSRTEHKTASAHCHEHQLKFSCSFSIFDNAFYGSSCTGIWYKVWRNIWKYGGTSHDDNQQAEANPSSAETKKQITIDLRNDSVQNVSWCMLISDRHRSHFGSRYHTRADAATQAFFLLLVCSIPKSMISMPNLPQALFCNYTYTYILIRILHMNLNVVGLHAFANTLLYLCFCHLQSVGHGLGWPVGPMDKASAIVQLTLLIWCMSIGPMV